jgi:molybdopterin-guanine dinucleotide biosynthesis protein A
MDVSALILAGGRATRLGGIDKRELVIEGATIFERQVEVLAPRVSEVIVSSARELAGYRTVRDAIEGAGPLAGMAAGLAVARTAWLLVVAGDMPYLTGAVIDLIVARITEDCDAVGIRIGEFPEPLLCALRCATCAPVVERRIAAGQRKASRLLTDGDLRVCWIEEPALRAIDPELRALFNVNAPEDLPR